MSAQHTPQPWTFIRSDSRRQTYNVRRWLGANVNNMEYVLTRTGRIKLFRSREAASAAACNLNAKADGDAVGGKSGGAK